MVLSNKIYISDKVYIPAHLIKDQNLLNKYWEFFVFDEPLCAKCDNKKFRVNQQCKICPGLQKIIRMWGLKTAHDGSNFYTIPAGQIAESLHKLNINPNDQNLNIIIEDHRCDRPFEHDLVFTAKLRKGETVNGIPTANQQYLVDKWLEKGSGLIEAPPRTGKTVIGTYLSCFLQRKTLITAHQEELLQNFYKTYESMTNLPELRRLSGKTIVKVINKIEELDQEDYDVILVNYQKFIREQSGEDRINKYLKNKYSFIVIDECHQAAAECFAKFLNKLNPKYSLGLSATPKRKDCIEGSQLIHTEKGLLSIKEICNRFKAGEQIRVYSKNKNTGQIELKPVLEIHEKVISHVNEITLDNNYIIRCTKDHYLY